MKHRSGPLNLKNKHVVGGGKMRTRAIGVDPRNGRPVVVYEVCDLNTGEPAPWPPRPRKRLVP